QVQFRLDKETRMKDTEVYKKLKDYQSRIGISSKQLSCVFRSKPATIPEQSGHPSGANRPPLG
ncbi:MAG: hypothetical protein Q7J06_07545, partial [Bacteroidales bacterium]|nr:hypothetical protein [Bacteroidales bacterium]